MSSSQQQPPTPPHLPPSSSSATTTNPGVIGAGADAGADTDASRPAPAPAPRPRIAIQYCTQCKWMLRAAYFAQELLSTFSTDLQEVSLVPCTGGIFTVTIYHHQNNNGDTSGSEKVTATQLWDRKTNGGFPEVKVLKSLVRNVVDPGRSLGHTDRALKGHGSSSTSTSTPTTGSNPAVSNPTVSGSATSASTGESQPQGQTGSTAGKECEDCR